MDFSKYFWQGDKVRLRPLHKDDAQSAFECMLDSPARRVLQLGIELPYSIEWWRQFLEKYADCKDVNGIIIFTVEDVEGNNVGGISFHSRHRKNGTFTIGLDIDAPYRRKGYGRDAMRILMRYAFHERRYQKCNSGCVDVNEPSIQFHKNLGFVEEGRRRRHIFFNGQFHDDILFGLTREEFDAGEAKTG